MKFPALVCLLALAPVVCLGEDRLEAQRLYREGRVYERDGKVVEAYLKYAAAAAADPNNRRYWGRSQALRTKAVEAGAVLPAIAAVPEPTTPDVPLEAPDQEDLKEAARPQPPLRLEPKAGVRSFAIRGDAKQLFSDLAKACGLDVVFDGDYQAGPPLQFTMTEVTCAQALHGASSVTASFLVPISPKLFLVVKDTPAKRTEAEAAVAVSVPIPLTVSNQEAQEMATGVRTLMELTRVAVDNTQRVIILRGPGSKIEPAVEILRDLMRQRAQVFLEVEVLTVSKTRRSEFGLDLQASFPLVSFGELGKNLFRSIPSGFKNFATFGGGLTLLGIGVTGAELFANASMSDSRSVMRSELRTVDSQPVSVHVGDKYPIVTTTFLGPADNDDPRAIPPPLFNFEDLGLSMKITPRVHDRREVTLELEAEMKTLGSDGINGIPIISNRKVASRVRLRFDETAIVAGLMTGTQARALGGYAGYGDIPVIGPLLGRNTREKTEQEVLLVIRPRLVDLPPSEYASQPLYTGTESRPRVPL